ncbi:hypothetical protein CIK05_09690 [Bdellovibrio sp. qaytius]|nr:hypothetical protein CIK05_09690 [Bdellovibrio sp. qaytius]
MKALAFTVTFIFILGCKAGSSPSENKREGFSQASDGVVNGGGGKGIRCGNKVRTLDLYEGELKGYPTPVTSGDFETDFKNNLQKVSRQVSAPNVNPDDPAYQENDLAVAHKMLSEVIDIPNGQRLDFTADATLPALPAGCSFVQIAVNVVSEQIDAAPFKIYRDKELWNMMSPVDQVALSMHEYIYATVRVMDAEPSSDDTRALIARMFSDLETYELYSPIRGKSSIAECIFIDFDQTSGNYAYSQFYAAQETINGITGLGIYFAAINKKLFSSRTKAFIPGLRIEALINKSGVNAQFVAKNFLINKDWQVDLKSNSQNESLLMKTSETNQNEPSKYVEGSCNYLE